MNKLIITGRLTRDAEVKYLPSGKPVMQFSVANNTGYGDKQQTHYFDCSLFGDRASGKLQEYMTKGAQVLVEGEVSLNTYQKNDGTTGASQRVFVRDVELIGGKAQGEQAPQQKPSQQSQKSPQNNQQQRHGGEEWPDDIPFANMPKIMAKHHLI